MEITNRVRKQMWEIIENKEIKAVFQPIVSLKTGEVYGYEALSRISKKDCDFNIGEAFEIAQEMNCLWMFEKLCRVNSIKMSIHKPKGAKLFLNVDPNIMHDPDFKSGITHKKLRKYNLNCGDIIFEATERSAIEDMDTFKASLKHYKEQGFRVAMDDVGSGYSGINRIFDVNPSFIKIDMEIIRNIENDELKRSFVSLLSKFSEDTGIALIAEGIETEKQLEELIALNIDYAQGYYLAKPSEGFETIDEEIQKKILEIHARYNKKEYSPAYFNTVEPLCSKKTKVLPDTDFQEVYRIMQDSNVAEVAVVDEEEKFLGILTNHFVLQAFGGMYGYNLNSKKKVSEVMDKECLIVEANTSIETVAKMAMERCQPYIYDAIAVVDGTTQKYIGLLSIKELLMAAVNIQVRRATECNPLTGLPGNNSIEERVKALIGSEDAFSVIYFDLDHFKAYNDAYGFNNGDAMIRMVSEILQEVCRDDEFCGHVGGDDFVVITKADRTESLCECVFERFKERSAKLYSPLDRKRGYIVSKNRNGFVEEFPLATLSVAAITNRVQTFASMNELSLTIAQTKKLAKQSEGNSLVVA